MEDSFVSFVLRQVGGIAGLGCRAMFGGHGVYRGPTLFGIVSAGRVYFKTDDATVQAYELRGMKSFHADGPGELRMYYELPADVLHDRRRAVEWAEAAACSAAARSPSRTATAPSGR